MSLSIIVMGASGRMGTTIANLAKEQGMTLAAVLERPERLDALAHWGCLAGTDPEVVYPQVPGAVVIDFTAPEASLANARCAVKNGNPIVIGTTGFTPEQKAELDAIAQNGRVFWSPNMSVGVNVLLELLPELVQMLGPDYDLEMVELHHNRKKDSPSGTALRLAESLASARDWDLKDVACYHREGIIGERPKKEIGVQAIRGGDVVGVHSVYFTAGKSPRTDTLSKFSFRKMRTGAEVRVSIPVSTAPGLVKPRILRSKRNIPAFIKSFICFGSSRFKS